MAQVYPYKGQGRQGKNKARKVRTELISKAGGPVEFKLVLAGGLVTVTAPDDTVLGYSTTQSKAHKFVNVLRHQAEQRKAAVAQ